MRSLLTSTDVRLAASLRGRPAVLLLVAAATPAAGAATRAAADAQVEVGPWFTWAAVLSGPFSAPDVERVRSQTPLRLERLLYDREGTLSAALGDPRLPALLLVDEVGILRGILAAGGDDAAVNGLAGTLEALALSSRRRTAGGLDFRLPAVGGSGLVSFLDVAGRDGTLVVFLQTGSLPCARALEVLDYARTPRAGSISFVAVFLDQAPDARVRAFLAAADATPDFVLRDPQLRLARAYGASVAPAIVVVDTWGEVVLERHGYHDSGRDQLYADLTTAFDAAAGTGGDESVVAAARRLHDQACAFLREGRPQYALLYQQRVAEMLPGYPSVQLRIAEAALAVGERDLALRSLARYLAAQPQTYDSASVRAALSSLLVAH